MRADVEEIVCGPPSCLDESGVSFRDGDFATVTLGAELLLPLGRHAALRIDGRAFVPFGGPAKSGDSSALRPEIAGGVQALF